MVYRERTRWSGHLPYIVRERVAGPRGEAATTLGFRRNVVDRKVDSVGRVNVGYKEKENGD